MWRDKPEANNKAKRIVVMTRRTRKIHPEMRNTLEYAEARKLMVERGAVKQRLGHLDDEIRSVRRISPMAVELARRDVSGSDHPMRPAAKGMLEDGASDADEPDKGAGEHAGG